MRTFKNVIAGLQILSKYYEDDDIDGNYDAIYVSKYEGIEVSEEDKKTLLSIGWYENSDSWSI